MSWGRWCASGCTPWRLAIEDLNDHEGLRFDPMVEILSGTLAPTRRTGGPALAGKRTLNRLERLAGEGIIAWCEALSARCGDQGRALGQGGQSRASS